jgi:hypothetical protein
MVDERCEESRIRQEEEEEKKEMKKSLSQHVTIL